MSWILVPLQYLFLRWQADRLLQKTAAEKNPGAHSRAVRRSLRAVEKVEIMQMRFPAVTDRLDEMRRKEEIQESYKA